MVMLPAHSMKKLPDSVVSVWLLTVHWKLPHDEALGTVRFCDAQVPRYERSGRRCAAPPPALSGVAWLGASTLLWRWNPQALDRIAATASATDSEQGFRHHRLLSD